MSPSDEKKRPQVLDLTSPSRTMSNSSNSTTSTNDSLKPPRTPRFAEATAVVSPVDSKSPFSDNQVADVGFGYIAGSNGPTEQYATIPAGGSNGPKPPLKSAMKSPGVRRFDNPLSPTFHEEQILEKREAITDKEQVRDLKIKTRVRLAKFALRGVNFSCSLIILAMLSSTFAIFNTTRSLPSQSAMPAWAEGTKIWPQVLVLTMACISLTACIIVFIAYCRGGHRRAEKVQTYYTMFAIGWFIVSMVLWAIAAGIFQYTRNNSNNKDMWGWSCVDNKRAQVFSQKVDYALVCRLQNWALICMIIEIVIEVICIALYTVIFYRYYTKRRLRKTMNNRDKARSDLYLAQLRAQSAPNTPGFAMSMSAGGPKSPAFSSYALSPRFPPSQFASMNDIESQTAPNASFFTPGAGARFVEPQSQFGASLSEKTAPAPITTSGFNFKLQKPPVKAPSATPKSSNSGFSPTATVAPPLPAVVHNNSRGSTPEPAPVASEEPTYAAVPIPGAYGQAQ